MKNLNDMSEEEQINFITSSPSNVKIIQRILNPSEAVQLAAVQNNENNFQYIKNPSEKVQLAAVKRHGLIIEFIKNPSERVQLAAVTKSGYAIGYINNPTKEVLIFSLLKILQYGDTEFVKIMLERYSDRNYPEFAIIRQSIEADK